ncbi:MAG: cobalamin-dependent protein [Desulfobacterales bacterium]|nr:MAG: cobalamin-dependent protein [Desulfobacterales bacterium]
MNMTPPVYPLGTRARILLSSVFGPYARNDEYGSRLINPMELYQNQVTRVQGAFSLRMFHRSFGLMMIQANVDAPCTLLDFPSMERFVNEIKNQSYDIVGISSIIPNLYKVKKMCELIRKYLPQATIVIGGHVVNINDLHEIIDADHIVKGDGIQWFRTFLNQDITAPIKHPQVYSAFGSRIVGVTLKDKPGNTAAMLLPSAGCPVGCNFCSTSALFGGKGKFVNFYETGDELFSVMCQLEDSLKVRSFFTMDENFLLHRKRALRLLDLMKAHNKSWSLMIFSSARVLKSYTIEQLVRLGASWVWMGLEGEHSHYAKLNNVNTRDLVKVLQSHGIRVLGSSIIGLEGHTPQNIDRVIDYAVRHDTDFHQFMLYTPLPGTPLYEQHANDGTLLHESAFPIADAHGQYRFNYRHQHIFEGQEEQYIIDAFKRDFEINGPSLARLIRTILKGWQRYKHHEDERIRDRFDWEVKPLRTTYAGAVWAMKKWYKKNRNMSEKMNSLLYDLYKAFGWKTKLAAPLLGRYAFIKIKQEEKRLANGWVYEPHSFYEKNAAAIALKATNSIQVKPLPATLKGTPCEPFPARGH